MNPVLKTDHMAVGYGKSPLIRDICLHVKPGEIVTLIGPNGAGKSTILKSLTGQLKTLGGTVYLGGVPAERMTEKERARRLAAVMTDRVQPEMMTCRDVVAAGRYPYTGRLGILSGKDRAAVEEALSLVGGEELMEWDFMKVSDGQRQKILLARAICQDPEVLVLDEPTSYLDARHRLELLSALKRLVKEKHTAVLMSLHELDMAQRISDYVVCVGEGGICRRGRPEEIFTSSIIEELYGLPEGSYLPEYGSLEFPPSPGKPEVFVIGGQGRGIPVYRRLQREGIPFAAGILYDNDMDVPAARALAAEVICAQAFEPVSEEVYRRAESVMDSCRQVICCLDRFGTFGEANRRLAERGREKMSKGGSPCAQELQETGQLSDGF